MKCAVELFLGIIVFESALTAQMAPANDNFANRLVVTGTNIVVEGSNLNAALETGEPKHAGETGGVSVWWSWTASKTATVIISTPGSMEGTEPLDTLLAVYRGVSLANLTLVASNDDDPDNGVHSLVSFDASAGVAYAIAVDGLNGAMGSIRLTIQTIIRPENDSFAKKITLSGETVSTTGSSVYATKETGEPAHAGDEGGHSVWWTWTAPSSGRVIGSTGGSSFDTLLGVYLGLSVGNLTLVASNDDDPDAQVTTSLVTFDAVARRVYQIAVDGLAGDAGDIALSLRLLTRPANDNFSGRITLTGTNAAFTGHNFEASKESGEPDHGGDPGGASVWWSWTAPKSMRTSISSAGSTFDTVLAVYKGATLSSLAEVVSNDDDARRTTSRVLFDAVGGTTYQIALDGIAGEPGHIQLTLKEFIPADTPTIQSLGLSQTGEFKYRITGSPGFPHVIQASTDLRGWADLQTNTLTNATLDLALPVVPNAPRRFMRVYVEP